MAIRSRFNPMGIKMYKVVKPVYTPLLYIESTGTQWINTGIRLTRALLLPDSTLSTVMDCEFVKAGGSFGTNTGYPMFTDVLSDGFSLGGTNKITTNITARHTITDTYVVNYAAGTGYHTLIVGETTAGPLQWNNGAYIVDSIKLFSSGTAESCNSMRLYSFKIADVNGKILYDMVPMLDPDGVPCMYDLIAKKPYYNSGTGEFLWGGDPSIELPDEYSRAYSVYFDGATYVNTGITPTAAPLYRTDIAAVVNTSRTSLVGAYGSSPYSFIGLRNNSTIYAGTSTGYGGSVSYSEKRCIWEFAADGAYVDNTKVYAGGVRGTRTWIIMGCYWGGSYNPMNGTFYNLTIRNSNNELIAEYIPVYKTDTEEYMLWETVSGTPVSATSGQIKGSE